MAFVLAARVLQSRIIRNRIIQGGIRTLTLNVTRTEEGEGGIVSVIIDGALKFTGFAIGGILGTGFSILKWSAVGILQVLIQLVVIIWNFNWTAPDATLDAQINGAMLALGSHLGEFIGETIGWVACGAVPGAVVTAFNEPLGLYILREVGEEAFDELTAQFAALMQTAARTSFQAALAWTYKNLRKLVLKGGQATLDLVNSGLISEETMEGIRQKVEDGTPWSFNIAKEERIESVTWQFGENVLEGIWDGFGDACIEAGYVVAQSIDGYMANNQISMNDIIGRRQTVTIETNPQTI